MNGHAILRMKRPIHFLLRQKVAKRICESSVTTKRKAFRRYEIFIVTKNIRNATAMDLRSVSGYSQNQNLEAMYVADQSPIDIGFLSRYW